MTESMTISIDAEKQQLRKAAKTRRQAAFEAAPKAGEELAGRVEAALDEGSLSLRPGAPVSAYWPKGDELDPRPLIDLLLARGHAVGLPVMTGMGEPLIFRAWSPEAVMLPAGFGLLEPDECCPELVPEVLFLPLLAFDRDGWRLGYGGGFYDRTLAKLAERRPLAVGLAYAGQEMPSVLHGPNDKRLDWIATERDLLKVEGA